MKAAFFQSRADYFGRPLDDGVLRALLACGFDVDLFAPGGDLPQTLYPDNVRRRPVEYRRTWLQRHLGRRVWREYDLFLGTADLPMAFAGALASLARRPSITVCDEIYLDGYQGLATLYWKPLTRWAMRRSAFTIITDRVRIPLQRRYAELPASHEFISYPCAYPDPYDGPSRATARRSLGVADDETLVSSTGAFTPLNACDWIVRLLGANRTRGVRGLIQTAGRPDAVLDALLTALPGVLYFPERLGFRESMNITVAADVAAVFYLSRNPQFQAMGVSSQKLCTALWLGMPVIATRQPSFDFIEEYGCGVLIDTEAEVAGALERLCADAPSYSANASRALRDYVRPAEHLEALTDRLRHMR